MTNVSPLEVTHLNPTVSQTTQHTSIGDKRH